MAIPNATFLGTKNDTHPVRADQTLVDHFRSRCCVTRDPASPTAKYHRHRRHSRNPLRHRLPPSRDRQRHSSTTFNSHSPRLSSWHVYPTCRSDRSRRFSLPPAHRINYSAFRDTESASIRLADLQSGIRHSHPPTWAAMVFLASRHLTVDSETVLEPRFRERYLARMIRRGGSICRERNLPTPEPGILTRLLLPGCSKLPAGSTEEAIPSQPERLRWGPRSRPH